jgi:ATP-dependent Lhr-like helicase
MAAMQDPVFETFHPAVAGWFRENYPGTTPPQAQGWPLIAAGQNVLLLAPTGSGKTLAAFLKCLDWLYQEAAAGRPINDGVKVLYISPLKALNNDISRNLEQPLRGIAAYARERGQELPQLTTGIRTGDTPGRERQRMLRRPPQILITTPESFFLMLSSQARKILTTVRFVIVDEIHTLFPTKRGAHLALSLERLEQLTGDVRPLQRIGLSATIRPLEAVAAYLGGYRREKTSGDYEPRPVAIVDTGQRKTLDLQILLPVPDMRVLPEQTVWPSIYQQLLELITGHRTTLVFVNNRRLAERITVNLNQLAGREIARTHHGSVSKEMRLQTETMLKAGEIPCIVATASLELGIDIGHIDLVVQIETPKEVARGLQRVGRAGHVIGMPSKGRIIPKTRGDLLECAALIREMKAGRVEPTKAICNSLDILAQQIVALTAERTWPAEEAFHLVRSAYNYRSLSRRDFENVLKMLAGQFETTEFVELRPRLYWDRHSGELKPDAYGKRLIYSSGGTIPDRGYYGVYLGDTGVRLGELDEEFVYERRLRERFVLGTATWRIEEIRQDRVIVSPARHTGEENIPFWKAEQPGRSFELGGRIGAFVGELETRLDSPELAQQWLQAECVLEAGAATNLIQYLVAQKMAVGALPTDKRLVVEEFPDEAGEWRVLIHSWFGGRVHLTLGLLIKEQWEREYRIQVELVSGDDGIMLHLPGGVKPPAIDWNGFSLVTLKERVAALVAATPLFGIAFRQAAQISLVMPRTGYGRKRTPFWLARLKAGNLLNTVSKYPDFPLVIETYRAVLQDHLELDALQRLLQAIGQEAITVRHCQHQTPSPFAGIHLFNFVGNFMYQGEAPQSERRKQLFGLGRETLQTFTRNQGFREILDPAVVAVVERKARGVDLLREPLTPEAVQSWLERLGDVTFAEVTQWFGETAETVTAILKLLIERGKVRRIALPQGRELLTAAIQQPNQLSWDSAQPQTAVVRRELIRNYARTRGLFQAHEIGERYRIPQEEVLAELGALAAAGVVISGEFRPGGCGEEWCEVNLLTEMQRRSLARARRDVATVTPRQFAAFLTAWQGVGGEQAGPDGLTAVLQQLSGIWLQAAHWEATVLPGRVADLRPVYLDRLIASGQTAWRARGHSRNLKVCFETIGMARPTGFPDLPGNTENKNETLPEFSLSTAAARIRDLLSRQGALSLPQILQQTGFSSVVAWQALEELIGYEVVTNDSLGPIRHLLQTNPEDRTGARGVLKAGVMTQWGRWSLLSPQIETAADRAYALLNRYGVVCREMAQAEELAWHALYPVFDLWENLGRVKRGYFVAGFSGVQFALPAAVERLSAPEASAPSTAPRYRMVGWSDPANPVKLFEQWPEEDDYFKPWGDYLVFAGGAPVLAISGSKKMRLKTRPELGRMEFSQAMGAFVKTYNPLALDAKLTLTHWNDAAIMDSPFCEALLELGFERGYRELTFWPSRRKLGRG